MSLNKPRPRVNSRPRCCRCAALSIGTRIGTGWATTGRYGAVLQMATTLGNPQKTGTNGNARDSAGRVVPDFETAPFDHSGTALQFESREFVVVGHSRGSGAAIYLSASILVHPCRARFRRATIPAPISATSRSDVPARRGAVKNACVLDPDYR